MIITRAPLRITFVGDATDLPAFYRHSPGRLMAATIDKYVYLAIKPTPLINRFIMKYHETEMVDHPRHLRHDRFREALLHLGITEGGLEIASFADIPGKTGLGSSSTFSVALLKGLHAYLGKSLSAVEVAEAACHLEMELLREPIGKQDQYSAAFGGFNILNFEPSGVVRVEPVLLDYKKRAELEEHLLLFFTGITRAASSVLHEQQAKIPENLETYKQMAASVTPFEQKLLAGDLEALGRLLHEEWMRKKTLASNVSNRIIDIWYEVGRAMGAWGGKVLGAGDGGCILFLAPKEKQESIRGALTAIARENGYTDFQEVPFSFSQSGADIIFKHNK